MAIVNHRAHFIDYRKPGIFLITMAKNDYIPAFSSLYRTGLVDKYKGTNVTFSPLGKIIYREIVAFNNENSKISFDQFVIMPDHVHFILTIKEKLEKHLDEFMESFQNSINRKSILQELTGDESHVFKQGYNDQFLTHGRSLDAIYVYIRENPYRLWIPKEKPHFFARIENGKLFDINCQFYGNINLLFNPFIFPVVAHSRYSSEEVREHAKIWEYAVKNGSVIASTFVNPVEKHFRDMAFEYGSKVIWIRNRQLEEREKPGGKWFDLFTQGKSLWISPELPSEIAGLKKIPGEPSGLKAQSRFLNSIIERPEFINRQARISPPPADKTLDGS